MVNGFYAIGECSCVSVHGANRLGTNSLLDLLVFGRAAGNHLIETRRWRARRTSRCRPTLPTIRFARIASSISRTAASIRRTLLTISARRQTHAGVFRTQKEHGRGRGQVLAVAEINALPTCRSGQVPRCFNTARIEALEVANLMEAAKATMVSAAARRKAAARIRWMTMAIRPSTCWAATTRSG